MGVDYSHYLMVGIRKNEYDEDLIEELEENYDVVSDGMCGEYFVVGKILMRSDLYRGSDSYEVDLKKLQDECEIIQNKFNKDDKLKKLGTPKVLSFIHVW